MRGLVVRCIHFQIVLDELARGWVGCDICDAADRTLSCSFASIAIFYHSRWVSACLYALSVSAGPTAIVALEESSRVESYVPLPWSHSKPRADIIFAMEAVGHRLHHKVFPGSLTR